MPVRKRAVKKTTAKKTAAKKTAAAASNGVAAREQAWADFVKERTGKSLDPEFLASLRKLYTEFRAEERAGRTPRKSAAERPAKKSAAKKTAKRAVKRTAKKAAAGKARKATAAPAEETAPVADISEARAKKTSAKPRKTAKSAAAPF